LINLVIDLTLLPYQVYYLLLIPQKMKRALLIVTLVMAAAVTITSCTAQRGGCKSSQGLVGYGSSR